MTLPNENPDLLEKTGISAGSRPPDSWRTSLIISGLLTIVAVLVYSPSLRAPWYLDDLPGIVQNPAITSLKGSLVNLFREPRGLVGFSFALNFRYGGIDPVGYHLVNLGLHICCGQLTFLLLRRVTRSGPWLPLLGALLFLAHPLQTQAVTYVVQRSTVLATLFFLLAVYLFVCARECLSTGIPFATPRHLSLYLGAMFTGLLALLTKENAIVLPVVLYLFVTLLRPPLSDSRRLLLSLLPLCAGALFLTGVRLLVPLVNGATLSGLAGTTHLAPPGKLTSLHYLITEFSVQWTYLRMLLLPYGQAFEHNIPIATDLFNARHLLAGAGLAWLGYLAVRIRRRLPLVTAGIAWFFLALAVESSLIPLDPLYEHRLYLPMFGFILAVLGLLELLPNPRMGVVLLLAAVLVCLPLSWHRNRLWANPVALYEDNLAKTPGNARILTDYGLLLQRSNRFAEAEQLLLQALAANPDYIPAMMGLIGTYNSQRRLPEAVAIAQRGLTRYPRSIPLQRALATLYANGGAIEQALVILDRAVHENPQKLPLLIDRAEAFARLGRLAEAEADFRTALQLDPDNVEARSGLSRLAGWQRRGSN